MMLVSETQIPRLKSMLNGDSLFKLYLICTRETEPRRHSLQTNCADKKKKRKKRRLLLIKVSWKVKGNGMGVCMIAYVFAACSLSKQNVVGKYFFEV